MAKTDKINICKRIRQRIFGAVAQRLKPNADWLQSHIAGCPRCQRRLASAGRVELALLLIKSQTHQSDLLARANSQAIGVLKHSLRDSPKAEKLRNKLPALSFTEKYGKYAKPAANYAACVAVIFLMKTNIFSSIVKYEKGGEKAIQQYYAKHLGEDLAKDVFDI
ncbi:MAG: hypothetical protein GWO86_01995 [Planctomycetes bacterium]|nr:hypothetical protein [Planctomycetota bacterium]